MTLRSHAIPAAATRKGERAKAQAGCQANDFTRQVTRRPGIAPKSGRDRVGEFGRKHPRTGTGKASTLLVEGSIQHAAADHVPSMPDSASSAAAERRIHVEHHVAHVLVGLQAARRC